MVFPVQWNRRRQTQCLFHGAGLEKSLFSPAFLAIGWSKSSNKDWYCWPVTIKIRWSSNICSAAVQALSRIKSVRDLWLASAARRNTLSCSLDALRPNREERVEDAFFVVDLVGIAVRSLYVNYKYSYNNRRTFKQVEFYGLIPVIKCFRLAPGFSKQQNLREFQEIAPISRFINGGLDVKSEYYDNYHNYIS